MNASTPHSKPAHQGFTLIEILLVVIMIGLLMIGMVGIWDLLAREFLALQLRQKAIFALHGQMERIAALNRHQVNFTTWKTSGYPATHLDPQADHQILQTVPNNLIVYSTTALDQPGKILLHQPAGLDPTARNVILLDPERRITGELSWTEEPLTTQPCYTGDAGGGWCRKLTLYLDYPYLFPESDSQTSQPWGGPISTLTLRTIVGRR
ncbi:hypothetical protein SIID45300_03250 [Candidatus Magnetaquicoccaceae bacterium FCR-1]|uniref:Prepilin-type N-terminal cleavage/methylation domain-containing protein n=1 Tax=Candidatus Magnetaquiglobus chichijimensis TaxID=3141448 RepID=A0ABQ0CDB1_9PROT